MQNATEFKPEHGAFARAARKLGKHRQQIQREYWEGKNTATMVAVAKASLEIKKEEAENRRKYIAAVKQHQQIANEVNKLAAEAAQQ